MLEIPIFIDTYKMLLISIRLKYRTLFLKIRVGIHDKKTIYLNERHIEGVI